MWYHSIRPKVGWEVKPGLSDTIGKKPSLLDNVIGTEMSCAGSFDHFF